jgi:hypothetical protein
LSHNLNNHIIFAIQQVIIMFRCSLSVVGGVSAIFLALAPWPFAMASDTTMDDGGHNFSNGKRVVWFLIAGRIAY